MLLRTELEGVARRPGHSAIPVWVLSTWLTGFAAVVLSILGGWIRSHWRVRRSSRPADQRLRHRCASIAAELRVKRPVVVLEAPQAIMPLAIGSFRPALLLPENADEWDDPRLKAVLYHELGHIRRWDCLTQLVAQVFCAVYWFHPVSWVISRRLRAEAEAACDDIAIRSGAEPAAYAEELLHFAKLYRRTGSLPAASAMPMARGARLGRRLRLILDGTLNRSGVSCRCVAMGLVALVGITLTVSGLGLAAGAE